MRRPEGAVLKTGVVAVLAAALAAVGYGLAAGPAAGKTQAGKATAITVIMTEYRFKLSKIKNIPLGKVVFTVVNKGKIPHDFKIAGKRTKMLAPGKSQTLTVTFTKKGSYAFVCDITGHARLGMKGTLGVATAPVTPPPTTTSATGTACTGTAQTTVNVEEFDYGFRLSQSTVPCGTITFVMTNTGTVPHDFIFYGVTPAASGAGPVLDPGTSKSMTVTVTHAGSYDYICDLPHHSDLGMVGKLTVTS
jgi:uncharacterized cupredoxin-like copper-binding protein